MKAPPRIEPVRKPAAYPVCGYRPVTLILYGLPAFYATLEQSLAAGRTVLGGCCVTDDDPTWQCSKYGQNIPRYVEPKLDQETLTVDQAMKRLQQSADAAFAAEDELIAILKREGLLK